MTLPDRAELDAVLDLTARHSGAYLAALDELPVRTAGGEAGAEQLGGPLPEQGVGAMAALQELIEHGEPGLARTGPRFFHFVQGGATPAALGADWLARPGIRTAGRTRQRRSPPGWRRSRCAGCSTCSACPAPGAAC